MYEDIEWVKSHRKNCSEEFVADETGFCDAVCRIYANLMYKHDYGKTDLPWQDLYDIAVKAAEEEILQQGTDSWADRQADWRMQDKSKHKSREDFGADTDLLSEEMDCDLLIDIRDTAEKMGEEYVELLNLTLNGYSVQEIAEKLEISPKTVHRMRKRLKNRSF